MKIYSNSDLSRKKTFIVLFILKTKRMNILILKALAILLLILLACTRQSKKDDHYRREGLLANDLKNIEKFKSSSGFEKWVAFMNLMPIFLKNDADGKPIILELDSVNQDISFDFDEVTRDQMVAILGPPDSIESPYWYIYYLNITEGKDEDGRIIAQFNDSSNYLDYFLFDGFGEDSRFEVLCVHILDSLASLNGIKLKH